MRHIGFSDVIVTQKTRDGGFDASAILKRKGEILSTRVLIECKRWQGNVGDEVIHKLRGVMKGKHVEKGIIFTTGDFTDPAYKCAKEIGDIELICGDELCNIMKDSRFGIKTEMKEIIIVNEDFLEKF